MWCFPPFLLSLLIALFYSSVKWFRATRAAYREAETLRRAQWVAAGKDPARYRSFPSDVVKAVRWTGRTVRWLLLPPRPK